MKTQRGRWTKREGGGIDSEARERAERERGREEPAAEEERGSFWTPSNCQDFQLSCTLSPPPLSSCLSTLQTQTPLCATGAPADGLIYAHQAYGAALKTSQTHAHNALHGANFNSQLCKCCREMQESVCLSVCTSLLFGDAIFISHTISTGIVTFPSLGSLWLLL